MKILIAPNAFKETLSAIEVADLLAESIFQEYPEADITKVPLADGGDGTLEVVVAGWGGTIEPIPTTDPLGRPLIAEVGSSADGRIAMIEMAKASGLALLSEIERDPMQATTFGLGTLIRSVVERGAEKIYLGIGGSATVDGGVGMAQALGFSHLNEGGSEVAPGGGNLNRITRIMKPDENTRVAAEVDVICDVTNPLCGPDGAAAVFGPQKGATPQQVDQLDRGLAHLADHWERDLGKDVRNFSGAGAAGGLGGGAMVYLNARLLPGADTLFEMTGLQEKVKEADLVITGEGKFDRSTLDGKLPIRVANLARDHNLKCYGICGGFDTMVMDKLKAEGFSEVMPIAPDEVSLEERKANAAEFVSQTGAKIGQRCRVRQ